MIHSAAVLNTASLPLSQRVQSDMNAIASLLVLLQKESIPTLSLISPRSFLGSLVT